MMYVKIDILGKNDPPILTENKLPIVDTPLERFVVLEGGMQSGKDSVAFVCTVDDKMIFMQCSAEMMDGLYAAMTGARQRWNEQTGGRCEPEATCGN